MKRNRFYEINPLNSSVTITRTFLECASQIDSEEFRLYQRFQEMGFSIRLNTRGNRRKKDSPLRSLQSSKEKIPLIPFSKMACYIACLDDADEMMDEFDAVRKTARSQASPRKYVNEWFRKAFPHYEDIPELDEENRIIHNPNAA